MNKGKFLSLDEIHEEEIKLLLAFDAFCKDFDIRYSLAGGTLLGAIRHKGFIPWDDDIDLSVPRPDWDKLISLRDIFKDETGFEISPAFGSSINATPFIKVINPHIAVQEEGKRDESFLWLDVIPLDGLPASDPEVLRIYKRALFLRKTHAIAVSTADSGSNGPRRLFKHIFGPVLRAFKTQRLVESVLNNFARRTPYGSTCYIGAITWGLYGAGERMPLCDYEKTVLLDFEGHKFSCMSCWDEYLSGIYGDYMQLPPEDQRVTHGLKAWVVDFKERN